MPQNDNRHFHRSRDSVSPGTLGTFAGVFTPSIMTILGIILFMRLGYVVGNAGLARALIIVAVANAISILTSISLAAIATNLKVKSGGDYYLISRTLGIEFGGSIGIVLYLAQSVSIAFYCIGFGEIIAPLLALQKSYLPQIIAAAAIAFLFVFAWLGADWATRFQYIVMTILGVALVSFFAGGFLKWDSHLLSQNWATPPGGISFWVLFAIFFPAVTGFTQGVSMSGNLKDPGHSLPLGTFMAVGISIIIYFLAAITFAATLPNSVMAQHYDAMRRVAYLDYLITAGVVAATLSSAMASFLGAPRILQSLASDRIFPILMPFAKGHGPSDNPRRGVLLSAGIAFATVSLGKLNLIAPVVSMFFLISYGLLNYATFYEARAASPSFRPRFRWFDWRLCLLGALVCLAVMLAIDFKSGIIAVAFLLAIFQYLKRTAGPARWADSRYSYHLQLIREHLLATTAEPEHPRNWRPQILAISTDPQRTEQLLRFSSWIEGNSGLSTVVRLLEGDGLAMLKLKAENEKELEAQLAELKSTAFPLVMVVPDKVTGLQSLIQAYGIGPLHANTLLLNWHGESRAKILGLQEMSNGQLLQRGLRYGCNVVVLDIKDDKWAAIEAIPKEERRIDVWWQDDDTGRFMLLVSYLMTRNEPWRDATIRLLAFEKEESRTERHASLEAMLEEIRIDAQVVIISEISDDVIVENSEDAALAFLPFRIRQNQMVDFWGHSLESQLFLLPVTAMVMAAEDIDLDAAPEEGEAAETAAVLDTLTDAQKAARRTEIEAEKSESKMIEAKKKLESLIADSDPDDNDDDELRKAKKDLKRAEELAQKTSRRAAKAAAKVQQAEQEAQSLGLVIDENGEDKSKDDSK